MGHGARGLQRRTATPGTTFPRPGALARLPLGRGRARRLLRRRAAPVPRACALERPRPDPQGADLRPDRQRGQPRRGRQGVLVVPRRAAEPRLELRWRYHYPQREFPYDDLRRGERPARQPTPSTSCSTPASSTTTATGSSRSTTPRPTRIDLLMTVRVTNAGPDAATLARAADGSGSATRWSWDDGAAEAGAACRRRRRSRHRAPVPRRARARGRRRPRRRRRPDAVLRQRDQRAAALRRRGGDALSRRTGSTTTSSRGAATVNPDGAGRRPRSGTALDVAPGDDGRAAAAAAPRGAAARGGSVARTSTRVIAERARRGRRVLRRADPGRHRARTRRSCCGRRSPACSGASSSTTTTSRAGSTATRRSRRRPSARRAGRNTRLAHLRRVRHHVDAGQVGVPVVRRLGPRVPLRRARPRRPGVRQVPADPALPRVVPAPERRAAGLRVVVRRRQPAGPGLGGARGVRDRRRRATPTSSSRIFDKLLVNFTWWVNREDADGSNLFEGGFLGLDNIGPIDRSHLPAGDMLEQSDGTGWMGFYALSDGGDRARSSTPRGRPATDLVLKFLEHFAADRRRARERRASGTRPTASSTTGCAARRLDRAGEGALDGRRAAAARRRR